MNLLRFAIGLCLAVAAAVVAIGAIGDGGGRFRLKLCSAPTAERDKNPDDPFQRAVADDRGHTMTIPSPPQRIASHEMTVEKILFAVVEESRIAAVSRNTFDARYSNVAAKVERLSLPMTTAASLHFSPPDGRSTRYDRQDFVALACRAQRTVQYMVRSRDVHLFLLAERWSAPIYPTSRWNRAGSGP